MPTIYITAPVDGAASLARELVEHRLAACVNQFPCHSTYRWDGDIVDEEEVVLLAKTTDERYASAVDFVRSNHPYETPCIERFDEADVFSPFADWRAEACRLPTGDG